MVDMELKNEIKDLIIKSLDLEDITIDDIKDDEPLFNDGLGLDSIDALEIGMALQKKYKLSMDSDKEQNSKNFYSINTLTDYVRSKING